jgi:hypothetical protein
MGSSQYPYPEFLAEGQQPAFTSAMMAQPIIAPPSSRQDAVANFGNWPLRSYLELAALPTMPSCARMHARVMLAEWGLAVPRDDTELVVSELTTNALGASPAAGENPAVIRLWLLSDAARLVIVVCDESRQSPQLTDALLLDEHGRGLNIVATLSSNWGWFSRPDMGGKCVWAVIRKPPAGFMA